jgi:cytosolic phospholipase A2
VKYQKELLSSQFKDEKTADTSQQPTSSERSLGGGRRFDAGSFAKKAFGFVREVGETAQSGAKYFRVQSQLTRDLLDSSKFPEVGRQAEVRRGPGLCDQEQAYIQARQARAKDAFAKYIGVDPSQVHPDDVPVVAFGGSGGGYRAMLALLGYSQAMKEAGLWDLLSYISGVSGSCE